MREKEDGNCEDTEAETGKRNCGQSAVDEASKGKGLQEEN
jgi:hypothetical protein